jgi:uracil-DNA glycosylase family 4
MPRNPECTRCELHKSTTNVCVWGDGSNDAAIVAIGEAPGEAEARTGKPFMGRSGQLLRGELAKAGLSDVYITNIVKCRPPDNRTPTAEEIKACRPYLEEELAKIKPDYVLTLGAPAAKSVLKKSKITQARGQPVDMPGYTGFPIFHPAYVLRDPSKLPIFKSDLERLGRLADGEVRNSEVEWELITSETFRRFVDELSQSDEFSFDLETSGLFPFDGKGTITCVNIGINDKAWLLPMDMKGSPLAGHRGKQARVMSIIYDVAKKKSAIGHNAKFDNHWLYCLYGIRFDLRFDTMLAHHILDENSPHDLEYMACNYLDVAPYDIPLKEKKNPTNLDAFYAYAGKDAVYTLRLKRILDKQFKKDPAQRKLFYRLTMRAARALQEIEQVGLTLDLEKMYQVGRDTIDKRNWLERELNKIAGRKVNWNAPAQVGKVLYEDMKIKCTVFTPKGAPSTSEAAIIDLKGKHPIMDKLIAYREAAKFYSTYIEGFRELMVDEKLFVSYKIHGTVTGRYSSRIHSIPRDGSIRNLVTAPPGWIFCQGDFSQAELRIAAILSGDLELRRCFAPGGPDVHWSTLLYTITTGTSGDYVKPALETAAKLAGHKVSLSEAVALMASVGHDRCIEIWKGWKEARKRAKAINFGFIYGMYEKKFIETCKLKYGFEPTYDEAHEYREAYFQLYRGIPKWHERTKKLVHLDGFVRSLSGRMRRLPGVHSSDKMLRMEAERQAINSPVQGFIGDLKAMAMVEIHETVPREDFRLVGEHHDALLAIVRESPHMDEVLLKVRKIMRHPALLDEFGIELNVPIEADLELGPWGAGKGWKPKLLENESARN